MPLTGAGTQNRLQIEADLQYQQFLTKLDDLDRRIDSAGIDIANTNKKVAASSTEAASKSSNAWTEFRSMYSTVMDGVRVAGQIWDETAGKFIKYADQVRDTSRALGTSTEEASRLIQVSDDVTLSYDKMAVAMKFAQKQGIEPSIEGLAKLSEEYLKLAPGVERTQFLLDKFGKSGADMGKLMEKGADGIRAMSAAIDQGQILDQKAVDQAREFQIAQDSLNDTWDSFTYKVAPPLIKATTDVVNIWRNEIDALTSLHEAGKKLTVANWGQAYHDAAVANAALDAQTAATAQTTEDATGTYDKAASSMSAEEEAAKKLTDQLKEQSDANKEAMQFTMQYADFQKSYEKDHKKAVDDIAKAQEKLNDAIHKGSSSDTIDNLTNSLHDAQKALGDLEISWHEKTQRMIFDMIATKLATDGLTDAEYKAELSVAVTMGIMTQAEADQAQKMMDVANATVIAIHQQEQLAASATKAANAYAGSRPYAAPASTNGKKTGTGAQMRDSGGSGIAGEVYMIGTGAQPEAFVPATNGTFVPNADRSQRGTSTNMKSTTIIINNPKSEESEDSIRKAMKNLSYLGVAS